MCGAIAKGNLSKTIYAIAKEASVSVATVSRVLNNKPDVSETTRLRILKLIKQRGFEPRVVTNKSDTLGIIYRLWSARPFANYYAADMVSGVLDVARAAGLNVLLISDIPSDIRDPGTYVKQRNVRGVIHIAPMANDALVSRIGSSRIPQVIIGGRWDDDSVSYVDSDNVGGVREAVRYLLNAGHGRIGFIGGLTKQSNHADRLTGYRDALDGSGIAYDGSLVFLVEDEVAWVNGEGGRQGMLWLLSQPVRPTAVIVSSGNLIMGALSAMGDRGLKVPDDISVVGYDDIPLASYTVPPCTTVRQPIYELGKRGTEELLSLLNSNAGAGSPQARHIVLDTQLIIRQSVRAVNLAEVSL